MMRIVSIVAVLALFGFLYTNWQGPSGTTAILTQIAEAAGAVRNGPIKGHEMDGTLPELSQADFDAPFGETETRRRLLEGCRAAGLSPVESKDSAFGLPTVCEGQSGNRSTGVHFDTECGPASCTIVMAVTQI